MSDHVLICDDEQDLREMVGEYLGKRGYRTTLAGGADELREKLAQERPDLILLDINMPGEDGLSVLRSLQGPEAPMVIMLTAAGEVIDRVVGLEMGADDYLAKPVDLRELASRIKAVLRRQTSAPEEAPRERTRFRFGKTWLDLDAAKLFDEEGVELPLTAMEFNLLKLFARNRGRVLNRDQILEGAHDRAWDPFDRSIDIRISRIRKKIEVNPAKPEVIRTVRGVGYIYDPG
ncbi:response regulator [Alloyangia pacifica]|uniref:Regulatory protein VirG n=1 Tax=Alloyangia pacifica TaxID=311180 RepID=A0A1I6VY09_9RHOB|nr:response regulator transcription factor [Alloyangia pacifica]SDI19251.1 two component transcriptional regulator, winged helix family [Alloyangia pacifica]SFT18595.1 two component transcriptional regulator, winged helix family [Alloyangia pacifica]